MKWFADTIQKFYPEDRRERRQNAARFEELIEMSLGLAGESGEVVDIIKKVVFHSKPMDEEHLKEELGDTLHYLIRIADLYEWSLEEIGEANVAKLDKRYGRIQGEKDAKKTQ